MVNWFYKVEIKNMSSFGRFQRVHLYNPRSKTNTCRVRGDCSEFLVANGTSVQFIHANGGQTAQVGLSDGTLVWVSTRFLRDTMPKNVQTNRMPW
jgi:hypothetical protein